LVEEVAKAARVMAEGAMVMVEVMEGMVAAGVSLEEVEVTWEVVEEGEAEVGMDVHAHKTCRYSNYTLQIHLHIEVDI
jgi:hypothetical protein